VIEITGVLSAVGALLVILTADAAGAAPPAPAPAPSTSDPPIELTWVAPKECPTADELKAEIRRVAGPVAPMAERPEANASIHRLRGEAWQLTLVTKSGVLTGERKLAAGDCVELMRAAALVMALMINPTAGAPPEPPPPPPAPPPPPPPAPPAYRFAAGADIVAGLGALPGLAFGGGLRFAAGGGTFSAIIRGALWGTRRAGSPSDAGAGGSFGLADAGVGGCARALLGQPLSLALCGGALILRTQGAGYGVTNPGQAAAWWSAGFLGGDLRWMMTRRHGLRIGLETVAPLARPTFALQGVGSVYRPAAIGARATLGWEVHF
jgi:hypothetical protein